MAKFHIPLKKVVDDSYDISIGRNLFPELINDLKNGLTKNVARYALITDSHIEELYGKKLFEMMLNAGFKVDLLVMPAGEAFKTRETKAQLEDQLLEAGFGRDSAIIALGGGVVSDLAGFLAGTFGRGIPFINYSTTLLSAADASVGGKTAVDTPVATNLIGLFYQPTKVYIDIDTWSSLPAKEIRSGLAETVKHACLADYEFFVWLEKNITRICQGEITPLESDACEYIAFKNCEIKHRVVKEDEKESNLRMVLNLGHTAGRAFEALCSYQYTHGECVAIGMVVQLFIAEDLGFVTTHEKNRIINLLKLAGLPTEIPQGTDLEDLVIKMRTDKKSRAGKIRFVLQEGIGKMKTFENGSYSIPLTEEYLLKILQKIYQQRK